jgi:phosphopantetheinyl transferase (holo-ACP synthase)
VASNAIGQSTGWRDIYIQKRLRGEPFLVFSGSVQELAATLGVTSVFIAFRDTECYGWCLSFFRDLKARHEFHDEVGPSAIRL